MTQTITATFEDGVLKPAQPLNLPEHAQVRLTIEPLVNGKTVEERLAAWDNLMRIAKPHPGPHLTRDELHERR
jgi:predicted DNA-binding antitoxin AbrB/MazE fold protein